jgi:putative transposase
LSQAQLLHKAFAPALKLVIIVKTNLHTHTRGDSILFSSDQAISYDTLRDPYGLRFHIEFNFRDAKQYDYSVLDLKADCRGYKYVQETIKLLPEKPEPVLLAKMLNQVACLGRIHAPQHVASFS